MSAAPSVRILASVLISSSPSETACFRAVDEPSHQVLSQARVLDPVGLDKALVNAPAGMDRSVALVGEQGLKVPGLGILTWLIVGWLGCLGAGCCWDCGGCVGWGGR